MTCKFRMPPEWMKISIGVPDEQTKRTPGVVYIQRATGVEVVIVRIRRYR